MNRGGLDLRRTRVGVATPRRTHAWLRSTVMKADARQPRGNLRGGEFAHKSNSAP